MEFCIVNNHAEATRYAQRWLRKAKKHGGVVTVLGGGWWQIAGWRKPVQGFGALARRLETLGVIVPSATFSEQRAQARLARVFNNRQED